MDPRPTDPDLFRRSDAGRIRSLNLYRNNGNVFGATSGLISNFTSGLPFLFLTYPPKNVTFVIVNFLFLTFSSDRCFAIEYKKRMIRKTVVTRVMPKNLDNIL